MLDAYHRLRLRAPRRTTGVQLNAPTAAPWLPPRTPRERLALAREQRASAARRVPITVIDGIIRDTLLGCYEADVAHWRAIVAQEEAL
jgi:hypothetical protein